MPNSDGKTSKSTAHEYSADQIQSILAELGGNTGDAALNDLLDQIAMIVGLTAAQISYLAQHEVPDWLHSNFRDLGPAIKKIVKVLDHEGSEPIREVVPNLRRELNVLRLLVDNDQRTRGRPSSPENKALTELVERLGGIWSARHGIVPSRYYDDARGRDWGRFHSFVDVCLKPVGLSATDHIIRGVIENFRPPAQ